MRLTFPKWGLENPPRPLKLLSLIAGVKTLRLKTFLISLESYQNVDVEKWPRMNHLDICSTSYGKKKG
jgi:hypothetical protein